MLDALTLLTTRQSCPRLQAPAPDAAQLQTILEAAVRVPDHAALGPWEFIIATGEGLERLGAVFVEAAKAKGADEAFIAKAEGMPKRAPMVITVVAKTQEHPKVPVLEQQIAAGCALMAMQQAAFSLGLGGIWRTGDFAFDPQVHAGLGLGEQDQIVGFLYLGTPVVAAPTKASRDPAQFVRYL